MTASRRTDFWRMGCAIFFCVLAGCGGGDVETSPESGVRSRQAGAIPGKLEIFSGMRSAYVISDSAAGLVVSGPGEAGVGRSVARQAVLRFADVSVALDRNGAQARVFRLYQGAFGRMPELAGLSYWIGAMERGAAIDDIADAFIQSAEFGVAYGVGPAPKELINQLYWNILGRDKDWEGEQYWLAAMAGGASAGHVLVQFSDSTENLVVVADAMQHGVAFLEAGVPYQPVANAGAEQFVAAGMPARLDGGASTAALGATLRYAWTLVARPPGSQARLTAADSAAPGLTADLPGLYRAALVVSDGRSASQPAEAELTASLSPVAPVPERPGQYMVSTVAGPAGVPLYSEGVGQQARPLAPGGLAVDAAGNLFVADDRARLVARVNPAGVMTTYAGRFGSSSEARDGPAATAELGHPSWVALDKAGNLYLTETGSHVVRKVAADGTVTTIAGRDNYPGTRDGQGTESRLHNPTGIAVDGNGTVYVADSYNDTIRKIAPDGKVTTLAGIPEHYGLVDGPGRGAQFHTPYGLALDQRGNLYVADVGNDCIRIVTPAGVVSTMKESVDLIAARGRSDYDPVRNPLGLAFDASGNLYVSYFGNHTVRKFTPDGRASILAGLPGVPGFDDGVGSGARLKQPGGIAVDAAGNVYVTSKSDGTVRKITPAGVVSTRVGFSLQAGSMVRSHPLALARLGGVANLSQDRHGNLQVADSNGSTIRQVAPDGRTVILAGREFSYASVDGPVASVARFQYPSATAVDAAGNLYVAEGNTIRRISTAGVASTFAGSSAGYGSADGQGAAARFASPGSMAFDAAGMLYVADRGNYTIRRVTPDGQVSTLAGQPGRFGSVDGSGAAARFFGSSGLVVGPDGNLYVADASSSTVRRVTPAGVVTTVAGKADQRAHVDGALGAARFESPRGLAFDAAGNLYVSDQSANAIRKIGVDGIVSTIAGGRQNVSANNGVGSAAGFNNPQGLLLDRNGDLLVAEYGAASIRRIKLK